MMDRQAIFNTAYIGLAGQGFQKSMKGGNCAYRGDGGLKCAIGHCIPDENYTVHLEGTRADDSDVIGAIGFNYHNTSYEDDWFLRDLQRVHDGADDISLMRDRLHAFAKEYSFTIPDLPEQEGK